jgi:hypothetical protein
MHINSNTSRLTEILSPGFLKHDNIFKKGYILLNTIKIQVSSTLEKTSNNINKKTHLTRIKAKIVENAKGKERIVLTSCSKIVTISDTNKIFAKLFHNNHIGKGNNKLIQITGAGNIKDNITIKYSSKKISVLSFQYLKLSGALIIQLAKQNNVAQRVLNTMEVNAAPIHNLQQNTPLVITGHTALPLKRNLISSLETFVIYNQNMEISRLHARTLPIGTKPVEQPIEPNETQSISSLLTFTKSKNYCGYHLSTSC